MGERLNDGREIKCPMGRTGHCGAGVVCTVEGSVLEKDGPASDPRSIEKFCTGEHIECPSFVLFHEFQITQVENVDRVRKALDGQEDKDNEILEPFDAHQKEN